MRFAPAKGCYLAVLDLIISVIKKWLLQCTKTKKTYQVFKPHKPFTPFKKNYYIYYPGMGR